MKSVISKELAQWKAVLKRELSARLANFRNDNDIYGVAMGVPEEIAEPHVMLAVARESNLKGEQAGSRAWLERRYFPNWDFSVSTFQNACTESNELIEKIFKEYWASFPNESFVYNKRDIRCRDEYHWTCIEAMQECDRAGDFGHIWFKSLYISDTNLPIINEAFHRLNRGRALKEAAALYPRVRPMVDLVSNAYYSLRLKWIRWKIGAKR